MMLDALPLDFLLNLFLVALLLATIGYCAILNKRLSNMRDAHAELRHLTEEFDKALVRSKVGVDELKSLAQTTGKQFRDEIGQAKELIEELQLINASSTRIADRLQVNVAASAKRENTGTFVDDPAGLFDDEEDEVVLGAAQEEPKKFRTDAEKELLDMLTKST